MLPEPPTVAPVQHRLFQDAWPEGDYRFFQIAAVTEDLIGACWRWTKVFGVGPFHVLPKRTGVVRYRGTETQLEMQLAIAQAGPVQIELIQQTSDTPSIYREIYPSGGGLHHLCTITRDFDVTKTYYEALGYECVALIDGGAMRVGYFDTFADFGFITEVVEHESGFVAHLTAIAATCRDWDGRDPVRILTRDGYRVPETG